jgi:protease IV
MEPDGLEAPMAKTRSRIGCCLLGLLVVLTPFVLIGVLLWLVGSKAPRIEEGTALEIRIDGALSEGPALGILDQLVERRGPSIWEIRQALHAAAEDQRIVGVFLDIEGIDSGLGVVQELLGELDAFRASGKPVQALLRGDLVRDPDYLLALGADQIVLSPAGGLLVNGFDAEVTFWRGTLEKLGIVPYVFMLKEYKSAGEPFSRTEMSEAFRESVTAVLQDGMTYVVSTIAKRRGLDEQTVRHLIDRGLLTPSEGLQARLVDKLGYRDQVEQLFVDRKKTGEYRSVEPDDYLRAVDKPKGTLPHIAVLFGEGPIVASAEEHQVNPFDPTSEMIHGPKLAEDILEAAEDPSVKAIVLRVNSPGGSPVGSDHVYRAIEKAQGRGKKVVVSMSDVAGSGGYWIAMGADRIVCEPMTITGSIGVVFQKFDLTGLYKLAGANISQVKMGENADLMSATTGLEGPRAERVLTWMTELYEGFKKKVAEGRGLSVEQVETLARGRIWSGTAALERKLVDELGGLDTAIRLAKARAGIPESQQVELVVFPRPKGFFEQVLRGDFASARVRADLGRLMLGPSAALPSLEQIRKAAEPRVEVLAPTLRLR